MRCPMIAVAPILLGACALPLAGGAGQWRMKYSLDRRALDSEK